MRKSSGSERAWFLAEESELRNMMGGVGWPRWGNTPGWNINLSDCIEKQRHFS